MAYLRPMTLDTRSGEGQDASRSSVDATDGLRRGATRLTLGVALALVAVKVAAWLMTGSVALLAAAVDSLVDAAASLVTFLGVRYAGRPPDRDHRFGHGKGEAVAAFTQATFLAGAALVLVFQSVERLIFPARLDSIGFGIFVAVLSLLVAVGLVMMQTVVVRRTGSTAIAADRTHYATDIAVNAAVLASLALTRATGWTRADPVFALGIAAYMVWGAARIARGALAQLLDRELPAKDRERIERAVTGCAGAEAMHDLRTRHAGDRTFVEFHVEVRGDMSVAEGHRIVDEAEAAVAALLPGTVEVTGHLEPFGIEDERLDDRVRRKQSPPA